jgi:hypothetical protein
MPLRQTAPGGAGRPSCNVSPHPTDGLGVVVLEEAVLSDTKAALGDCAAVVTDHGDAGLRSERRQFDLPIRLRHDTVSIA